MKKTNVNRPESGTMPGSHILVHALHRSSAGELTVLLIHVVGTGTGVVSQPDTEVLHFQWLLLMDLKPPTHLRYCLKPDFA